MKSLPQAGLGIPRIHFGVGPLAFKREISVFINCPFDEQYRPLFDSIVFATVSCGFLPRSAIESGDVSLPRMDRITKAILSSKYSIHDLSRCRGEGDQNLARFNMPLELGIAMAYRFARGELQVDHDWLLLVPRGHEYKRFVSDMSGYDPKEYDQTRESVVLSVMSWLATRPDAVVVPTPRKVMDVLDDFGDRKNALETDWGYEAPWSDIVLLAMSVAADHKLIPQMQNDAKESTNVTAI